MNCRWLRPKVHETERESPKSDWEMAWLTTEGDHALTLRVKLIRAPSSCATEQVRHGIPPRDLFFCNVFNEGEVGCSVPVLGVSGLDRSVAST